MIFKRYNTNFIIRCNKCSNLISKIDLLEYNGLCPKCFINS